MGRTFPVIVTRPAGMLQKLNDVGTWVDSLQLIEIRNNRGFTGVDSDWAGRFAAAIWSNNLNNTTDYSPLPGGFGLPMGDN